MEVIQAQTLNFKPNVKFSRLNFLGGPRSQLGCALGSLGQSLARVTFWGRSTLLRAEILCAKKYPLGWVNMHLYKFLVCGPKFTRFLLSNVGGVVVVQLRVRFLTCRPVPGIFAIKFESCQKSRRNLDVFLALPNFRAGLPKIIRKLSPLPGDTSAGKIFKRIFPLVPKL